MHPKLRSLALVSLLIGSTAAAVFAPSASAQGACVPENPAHPIDLALQALAGQLAALVEVINTQGGQEVAVVVPSTGDIDNDCLPDMHFLRHGADPGARQSVMLQTDIFYGAPVTASGTTGALVGAHPGLIHARPLNPGPDVVTSTADPDTLWTTESVQGRVQATWNDGEFRLDFYNISSSQHAAGPSGTPQLVGEDNTPYFYVASDLVGIVDPGTFAGEAIESMAVPVLTFLNDYLAAIPGGVEAFAACLPGANPIMPGEVLACADPLEPVPPSPSPPSGTPTPDDTIPPWAGRGLWVGWLDEDLSLVPAEPLYAAPFDLTRVYLLLFDQSGDMVLDRDGDGTGDNVELLISYGVHEDDPNHPIPRFSNFLNGASVPADLDGDGVNNTDEDAPCVYDFDCVFVFDLDPEFTIESILDAGGDPIPGALFGTVDLTIEYSEDSPDLDIFQVNVSMKASASATAPACTFPGYVVPDLDNPPATDTITFSIDTKLCPDTTNPVSQVTDELLFEFTFVGATNATTYGNNVVEEVVVFSSDEYAIRNRPVTHARVIDGGEPHDVANFPNHHAESILVEVTYSDPTDDAPVNMTLRVRHNQTGVNTHVMIDLNQAQILANQTAPGSGVYRFLVGGLWAAHNATGTVNQIDDRDMYVRVWASDRAGCASGVAGCMNATQTAPFRLFHNNAITVSTPVANGPTGGPIPTAAVNGTDLENGTVTVDFRARYSHNDAGQDLLDFTLYYRRAGAEDWESCAMNAQHYHNAPPTTPPNSLPYTIFGLLGMGNPLGPPPYQAVTNQRHCELELLHSLVAYEYWFNATESGRILNNTSLNTSEDPREIVTYQGPQMGTPNATVGDTAPTTTAGRNVTFLVDYRELANLTLDGTELYEPTVVVQVIGPGGSFDDPLVESAMTNGTGTRLDGTYNITLPLEAGVYEYRVVATVGGENYSAEGEGPLVINPGATVTVTDPLGFAKETLAGNLAVLQTTLQDGLDMAALPNFWCPVNRLLNGAIGPMHCVTGVLGGDCPDDSDCDGVSDQNEEAAGADPEHTWNNPLDLDSDAIPDLLELAVDTRLWQINAQGNLTLLENKSVRVGTPDHRVLNITERGDTGLVEIRLQPSAEDVDGTPLDEGYEYAIVIGDAYLDVEIVPGPDGVDGIRLWIRNPWNMSQTYGFVHLDLAAVGTERAVATVSLLADEIDLGVLHVDATNQTTFKVYTDPPRVEQDGEPLSPPVDDLPIQPPADEDEDNVPDGWEKTICFLLYQGEDAYGTCDEDGNYTPPALPLP